MNVFDSALPAKYFLSRLDRNVEGVESHLDSVAKDIVDAIAEKSRYLSWEISDHIREVVASNEALQQEFGDKFDAAHERLILELGDIGESLEDVRVDLDHGFSLVTEQLELQNSTLIEIAKHLDNLYEITLNQEGTKARRLFLRGCELWDKGLLPEALDSLNKAATTYSADSITHFQLGKLYLNGKNKSDDVVDLEQAETHLKLAARYGEAEIKHEPKMAKFTGAALFLLSEACYRQGVESKDGRFKEISYRKAFEAAKKSISMYKDIPGNRYHLATVSALLGETVQAITSLRRAIKADRQFCLMVDKDKGFDAIRAKVKKLLSRLRDAARRGADSRLRTVGAELGNRKFVGAEELSLEKEIRTLITKAEHLIGNATYFDYLNALARLGEVNALIEKQKQNELTRREAKDQVEKSFDRLSPEAGGLQYEGARELELKRKIEDGLADAQGLISQASLNDYGCAQNILNEVLTLIESQEQNQRLRPRIKKETEAKISAASKVLEDAQGILEDAEEVRRKYKMQSDLFPGVYKRLDDARKALNLSKTKLQLKDYWSITEAKDLAEKVYDAAVTVTGNRSYYRHKLVYEPLAAKKKFATRAALSGGLCGAVMGGVFYNSFGDLSDGIIEGLMYGILSGWLLGYICTYILKKREY